MSRISSARSLASLRSKGQIVEACEGDGETANFAVVGFRDVGGDDEIFARRMDVAGGTAGRIRPQVVAGSAALGRLEDEIDLVPVYCNQSFELATYFATTAPTPNWHPARTGLPSAKSISSIFSLWTAVPCSSVSEATIFRVATSMTSPVDG